MATATINYIGYNGNTLTIYDASNNVIWAGSLPYYDYDSSSYSLNNWTATATRSSGANADSTAALSVDLTTDLATITLSGGTAYEFDLTGHPSPSSDSDDHLKWTVTAAPEISTGPTALTAPTITATATGSTTATIGGMTAASGETVTSWKLRRSTTSAGLSDATGETVTPTDGSLAITGLTSGTTYYWQAMAVGDGITWSDSGWSTAVSASTSSQEQLDTPVITNIQLISNTREFEWIIPQTSYRFCRYRDTSSIRSIFVADSRADKVNINGTNSNLATLDSTIYGERYKDKTTVGSWVNVNLGSAADGVSEFNYSAALAELDSRGISRGHADTPVVGITTVYLSDSSGNYSNSETSSQSYSLYGNSANSQAPDLSAEVGSNSIALFWNQNSGRIYAIKYSADSSFSAASTSTLSNVAPGVTVSDLTEGTTLYFRLYESPPNGRSQGAYSSAEATTLPASSAPTGLSATATDSATIQVTFSPSTGVTDYRIEWTLSTASGAPDWSSASSQAIIYTESGVTLSDLAPNKTYYLRVKSLGNGTTCGASEWTSVESATTSKRTLVAPILANLSANTSSITFPLSVEHSDGYTVEQTSTAVDGIPNWAGATSSTFTGSGPFSLTGLTDETTYYLRAKADANASSDYLSSGWSNVASRATGSAGNPPVIRLYGGRILGVPQNATFSDPGAVALDDNDSPVVVTGTFYNSAGETESAIDATQPGIWRIVYNATDSDGNSATPITRTVFIITDDSPTITLVGDFYITLAKTSSGTWSDPGATAVDSSGQSVTVTRVVRELDGDEVNSLSLTASGQFLVSYFAVDSSGRASVAYRLVNVVDTIDPDEPDVETPIVIRLNGFPSVGLVVGGTWSDPGATAISYYGETLTPVASGTVTTTAVGVYPVTYTATDSRGNTTTVTRNVYVVDHDAPKIVLLGPNPQETNCGDEWTEPGIKVTDSTNREISGTLTRQIRASDGTIQTGTDWAPLGRDSWLVTYLAQVGTLWAIPQNRVVRSSGSFIQVPGDDSTSLDVFEEWTDPGAAAYGRGNRPLDVTRTVLDNSGNVLENWTTSIVGTFLFIYTATNETGTTLTAYRTVTVSDHEAPDLTLAGESYIRFEAGESWTDPGVTALDNYDGDLTSSVVRTITNASGTIEANWTTSSVGTFTFSYAVSDAAGNAATPVTRVVNVVDSTPPIITIAGDNPATVEAGTSYTDSGAAAIDSIDGVVNVVVYSEVKIDSVGQYPVEYTATDAAGNKATATRVVNVVDSTPPTTRRNGAESINLDLGETYLDDGIEASDPVSDVTISLAVYGPIVDPSNPTDLSDASTITPGDLYSGTFRYVPSSKGSEEAGIPTGYLQAYSEAWILSGEQKWIIESPGTYVVRYTASDASGNSSTPIDRLIVVSDPRGPTLTLAGSPTVTLEVGEAWSDPGATASDGQDGNLTSSITSTGSVNTEIPGTYRIIYTVTDSDGKTTTATRTIYVVRPILILGDNPFSLPVGRSWVDPGAVAWNADGSTASVAPSGVVDSSAAGSATIVYTATFESGQTTTASRTININAIFEAFAISSTVIRIVWPTSAGVTYEVRRRPTGSDTEWTILATGLTTGRLDDDSTAASSSLTPNTKFDYQYRATGGNWSESDVAWLTDIFHWTVLCRDLTILLGKIECKFNVLYRENPMTIQSKQTPPFVARIERAETGAIIEPDDISSIQYTIRKRTTQNLGYSWSAVTGHSNVIVPTTALLEAPVWDRLWEGVQDRPVLANEESPSLTDNGYNFKHEPDSRTNFAFPEAGIYEVVYTLTPVSGNPIILNFKVTVTQ